MNPTSSAVSALTANLSPYPTVLVGLGGLGGFIVRQVHGLNPGDHVTYVVVDTDAPKVEHGDAGGFTGLVDLDAIDPNLSIVRMAGVDLSEWRESHAGILDGIFPVDLPTNLASGAAKKRMWGSAAGWEANEEIYRALESAMKRVRREEGMDNRVVRLRFVTGTSGGTGSANVLKAAMIAHQVFNDNWDAGQVSLEIQILLVLPDCYNVDGTLRSIVEVNGAWCLRELAHAQREGMTLVFPSRTVSVPPGFISKAICIGASSVVRDITEAGALEQIGTALLLDSDPAMGKAVRDEDIDVIGNMAGHDHFVSGVGAYRLRIVGSAQLAADLFRRKVAQAFLALPVFPNTALAPLSAALLPTSFGEVKASIETPSLGLAVKDVVKNGAGVVATVNSELDTNLGSFRGDVNTYLAGKRVEGVADTVRAFACEQAGRYNPGSIANAIRAWVRASLVSVPNADSRSFRSRVSTLAEEMEQVHALESRKATVGEAIGKLFGGKGKPAPETSSSGLAGQIIGLAEDHFDSMLASVLAEAWNGFVTNIGREALIVAAEIEQTVQILTEEAGRAISMPTAPESHDYRQVVVVRPEDVERLLPSIDCSAIIGQHNIFTNLEAILGLNAGISDEAIMLRHPEVLARIDSMLRSEACLSYSAARCDNKPTLRYFISGPAGLKNHPRVKELLARKQLRWVEDRPDQVNVVAMVYGVKPGAIAGVDTWERHTVGKDNAMHVSMLPALRYPGLIQVKESLVVEPFLVALVVGEDLAETPDESNPWSYTSPDALLRRLENGEARYVFQPYPGKGRQAIELGSDLGDVWDAFKLDLDGVRTMAAARARDLVKKTGWESIVLQVNDFTVALYREIERRNAQITGLGKPTDAAGARNLFQLTQVRDQLHTMWERANRWLEDKKRAAARR